MTQVVETVEAVIITGDRRGEIIRLDEDTLGAVSPTELNALNEALDSLLGAVDRLAAEVRAANQALKPSPATV
jgi:hypothetical protein